MKEEYCNFCGTPDSENPHRKCERTVICSNGCTPPGTHIQVEIKEPRKSIPIPEYWFKFRDSIFEVGKPNFSIVSNDLDEHPNPNVVRISDCKFEIFIDISCHGNYQDALERANALCNVLNADYPFLR